MARLRNGGALAGILLLALAGCAGQAEDLKAPTLQRAEYVLSVAAINTLKEIRVGGDELCPINERGALLVFAGTATGPADGAYLDVNGTWIKAGDVFLTGEQSDIDGGFDCGGEHFENARRVLVEEITLSE